MGHFYYCAICGNRVPLRNNHIDQITYPYCPYCGHKFDWSEVHGDEWKDIVYNYKKFIKMKGENTDEKL